MMTHEVTRSKFYLKKIRGFRNRIKQILSFPRKDQEMGLKVNMAVSKATFRSSFKAE